jgi:hypothetical protein
MERKGWDALVADFNNVDLEVVHVQLALLAYGMRLLLARWLLKTIEMRDLATKRREKKDRSREISGKKGSFAFRPTSPV